MKRNLYKRDQVIHEMLEKYKADQMVSLELIDKLQSSLSNEEASISEDSLISLKIASLSYAKKFLQAYQTLVEGLIKSSGSIHLFAVRDTLLSEMSAYLSESLNMDPLNPMNEALYDILLKESYMGPQTQSNYLNCLIECKQFEKARSLAETLVSLYPRLPGLQSYSMKILEREKSTILSEFLFGHDLNLSKPVKTSNMSFQQKKDLSQKLTHLRRAFQDQAPIEYLEKELVEVTGSLKSTEYLDTQLKDFYYLHAILEERKENYFESLMLFHSLVELDPCKLDFRKSLKYEMDLVCSDFLAKDKAGTLKVDLVKAYPLLKEIGLVSYELLTRVCLAEVKLGLKAQAKEKMNLLMKLNPFDQDYVNAALTVAKACEDAFWKDEVESHLEDIRSQNPWEAKLSQTETAFVRSI